MAKKRRKFRSDEKPRDNPLGIGLSTKTLTLIGVGIVAAIALKLYLDKRKAAKLVAPAPTPGNGDIMSQLPPGAVNGVGSHNPVQPSMPAQPPNNFSGSDASMSPPSGRNGMDGAGRFSGMGDGGLSGGNRGL